MTNENLVSEIINRLGGDRNIESAINCMTRIRVQVRDDSSINDDGLKELDGVLGVVHNQPKYLEIVVGPGKARKCIDIFREKGIPAAVPEAGSVANAPEQVVSPSGEAVKKDKGLRLLKRFSQIFAPLIPGITAAGICAGLASLMADRSNQMLP